MGSCWLSLVFIAMGLWGNSVDLGNPLFQILHTRANASVQSLGARCVRWAVEFPQLHLGLMLGSVGCSVVLRD